MSDTLLVLAFSLVFFHLPLASSVHLNLREGFSLSVENPDDILISSDGVFSSGFYAIGKNAYCFAIWYNKPFCNGYNCIVVWTANRDQPVNGRDSKLSLTSKGELVLTDVDGTVVWAANKGSLSRSPTELRLLDTGNLVLRDDKNYTSWQSFDSPTDTLLPGQKFTSDMALVSSKSKNNFSSGHYKFYFDNDNVLRLLFSGPMVTSVYWPDPWLTFWEAGRTTYDNSRIAVLDSYGNFTSSDGLKFLTSDNGVKIQRRLTVDLDGNIRVYSLSEEGEWMVSWQAISDPCTIHGICGPNSLCSYDPSKGRTCFCAPGYERSNHYDMTEGCKPTFESFCGNNVEAVFVELPHSDFYGYDIAYFNNITLEMCKTKCLEICNCVGFQYKFNQCFPKILLLDGYNTPACDGTVYFKLPISSLSSYQMFNVERTTSQCPPELDYAASRTYLRRQEIWSHILLIVAGVIAGAEAILLLMVFGLLIRTRPEKVASYVDGYQLAPTSFRRFTYRELQKATRDFSEVIGIGSASVVYKAVLSDGRTVAVKQLNRAKQGENEFLAEVSTIGKLHHMNLIDMWGYCAEGKQRLLVYEFMDHGSLAEKLSSSELNWTKRFEIALGSAKGLAYLHEECLEWVLHCDVKPQNILLDSDYQPKVSDFGLSKILNRSETQHNMRFSKIRGTRGYMAPEWVYNLPITSKVDVYSYGIVLLEMVTGRSPLVSHAADSEENSNVDIRRLVSWVREKMELGSATETWIEEILDPKVKGVDDAIEKIKVLVEVALRCVDDDRNARPTMSQVVEMLLLHQSQGQN